MDWIGVVLMTEPPGKQMRFYTYKDYLEWPEDERWEIIDGVAFNMTPAPSTNHQRLLGELFSAFNAYLKGKACEVFIAPFDVRLPRSSETGENASTVVQPDLTVIRDARKIDRRGCQGSPDLVIEITSPSTLAKDLKHKLIRYEASGVREYWIIHCEGKTVLVYNMDEDGRYKRPRIYTNEDRLPCGIFPDFELNLQEIFSVIPDEI